MTDKTTTIVIKGKVGYEDVISPAQAAQIIAFLDAVEGEQSSFGPLLPKEAANPKPAKKAESAREALDLSEARTNPEKIVALGAYVLQDGGETFKVADV